MKIFICLTLASLLFGIRSISAQQLPSAKQQQEVIILGQNTPIKRITTLTYIGEVKNRSYIKIILEPVDQPTGNANSNDGITGMKGTCYEAASGNTYMMSGTFNATTRIWMLKCLNSKKQTIYTFKGRENYEGTIEGTWKSRRMELPFYLFKKENNQ